MTTRASSSRGDDQNPGDEAQPSRRAVLAGGAALAAAATTTGGSASAFALAQSEAQAPTNVASWILGRASFGVTPAMIQDMNVRGVKGWVDWQLEHELIDDSAMSLNLLPFDWLGQSVVQMWNHPTKQGRQIGYEARALRLVRATYSRRQLFERVVEFWTDHFNVFGASDDLWLLKIVDDEQVIREHALGTFRDLLRASAGSPGMLEYLDNDTNLVGAPQENYAREVMELHTLGVDGPYTENDVRELARCFTGWSYWKLHESASQYGEFRYRPDKHDTGAKRVLGIDIPAGGDMSDAYTVLDYLADHPSTVNFVTTKLAKWFLGYSPPQAAIDAGKATWVATGGDIKEIVRTLLQPRFFRMAQPWRNPKLKRPLHWLVSLFRATGTYLGDPLSTVLSTGDLGQTSYNWHEPNGYPDTEEAWSSMLIWRWKYAVQFSQGLDSSLSHDITYLRGLLGAVPVGGWGARLSEIMTGSTMHPKDVREIQIYLGAVGVPSDMAVAEAFELAACSPSFGRY